MHVIMETVLLVKSDSFLQGFAICLSSPPAPLELFLVFKGGLMLNQDPSFVSCKSIKYSNNNMLGW